MQEKLKLYEAMLLLGKDGKTIASSIPQYVGVDASEREYFKAAQQGRTCVSSAIINKGSGKPIFVISAPITGFAEFDKKTA